MPKIVKRLSEVYPLEIAFAAHLRMAFFFGAFVLAFLYVFKPFGLSEAPSNDLLFYAAVYGAITFFTMLLNYVIILVLPSYFNEKKWFVWKQVLWVLWNILSISLINYLFTAYHFGAALSLKSLLWALGITFSVGVFPVSIMISISQVRFLKAHLKDAQGADDQLKSSLNHFDQVDKTICLSSENDKDEICFQRKELLYIESTGNYCECFIAGPEGLKKLLLRSSLNRLEELLKPEASIMRCHRSYIVNLENILSVGGNSQGLRLRIKNTEQEVPVSRNKIAQFKSRLAN